MKTNYPSHKNQSGFTLIELLTVIAVVGILAALIIPATSMVRQKALRMESVSNLRQLHTAINLYSQDNDGALPNPWIAPNKATNRSSGNWRKQLTTGGYLQNANLSIKNDVLNPENYEVLGSPVQRHLAPHVTIESTPVLNATYSMNGNLGSSGPNNKNVPAIKQMSFINPARTLLISEGSTHGKDQSFNIAIWPTTPPEYTGESVALIYLDGHIEEMAVEDFPQGAVGSTERNHPDWMFWRGQG